MTLRDSHVVVIGGGSGIGLAVACQALAAGAHVLVAGRDAGRLDRAVEGLNREMNPATHRLACACVDARDEDALGAFFAQHGPVDHLVVTVGPGPTSQRYRDFREQPTQEAQELFANKFWAQYLCAKQAAAHMAPEGSITLFGGGAARRPMRSMAVLAAMQAAIEGLVRGLALDLAPLRVNAVAPGRIASSSFDDMPAAQRDAMLEQWAQALPVQRIGLPDDAAQAALYLMSNRYTTGNVIYVDGGRFLV